jgi:hypothetical protein
MKKLAVLLLCLCGMTFAAEGSADVARPGNTVVHDWMDDFLIVECSQDCLDCPCTLPPNAQLPLPSWMDLRKAKITQIGNSRIDLFITLFAPIPETPPVPFLTYFWQFQDGCIEPSPTDKDGIRLNWDGNTATWSAHWMVITSCDPRTIEIGAPVPFRFIADGAAVRVSLEDLIVEAGDPLKWYVGVRRLPFVHSLFSSTFPVDVAPDVIDFDYTTEPPSVIHPEDSATWDTR